MSFKAVHWALHEVQGMGDAKLVLVALAEYADDDDRAWPSRETLAGVAECSRSTLGRRLKALEKAGLIVREARYFYDEDGRPHRGSTMYHLMVGAQPRLSEGAGQPMRVKMSPIEGADERPEEGGKRFRRSAYEGQNEPHSSYEGQNRGAWGSQVSPIDLRKEPPIEPPDLTWDLEASQALEEVVVGSGRLGVDESVSPVGGAARADVDTSGPAPSQESPVKAPGSASKATSGVEDVSGQPGARTGVRGPSGGLGDDDVLIAECLPPALQALDRAGGQRVARMLGERLEAGWTPREIRALMDQALPPKVHRLAALVASRLEANVAVEAAPSRLRAEADKRGEQRRQALREQQDRAVAEACEDRPVDPEWEALIAQARAEMPDAGYPAWTRFALSRRERDVS